MNLIIVESPTKEKTISKFLSNSKEFNEKFIVKSSYGHIRDLPTNSLGVDEKNDFKPYYILLPRAKRIVAELKKILPKVSNVYLATDFDREGEAIAWHIVKVLGLNNDKVKRITFHEITPSAIFEALKNPRTIDMNLVNSQQARRIIDRLVGYKISPLLWKKIANKLSAGRVQSAALKFIYDRELEIEKFIPQEYWSIECDFFKKEDDKIIKARLKSIDNKKLDKLDIKNEEEAKKIVEEVKKVGSGEVIDIKVEEKLKSPLEPFITSTLQQEASKKLNFSPSKTMSIAQNLYEGVDLGNNERVGLITYMRTDSTYVSPYAIEELRKFIKENYGEKYLHEQIRKFKTKVKNAQEAHEAIRPTSVYRTPENIKEYLSTEQYKLYKLIWQRFVATQMKDMKYQNIIIKIDVGEKFLFESEVKKVIFEGYTIIYPDEKLEEADIPKVEINEILNIKNCYGKQHFTEPPSRYTEASLIKELEKNGIGRPSTYATIVDTLKQRGYVILKDRKFHITSLGKQVTELLTKYFPEIVDKFYTAKIEKLLDKISQGKENWVKVVSLCYEPIIKEIEVASKEVKSKNEVFQGEKCKICGGNMIIRSSKYGKFLSCENYPRCKYKINYYEENKLQTKNTSGTSN
jgi:DNA topoisomerase-1